MKKIALFIILFAVTSCASVHHEIFIEASPNEVWEVLTDSSSYSDWNTVMLDLKGAFKVGEKIVFQFKESDSKQYEVTAVVADMIPEKTLNQKGGI